jgi:nicotinamide-nucleotide amidase
MVRVTAPTRRGFTWADIIAVGTELLVPPRQDTNSTFIADRLNAIGIQVRTRTIVGDVRRDLEAVLRGALARSELVVLSGGLGPTDDDLTRDAVAAVFGLPLEEDQVLVAGLEARFAARGLRMPDNNRKQALVPRGAVVLENRNGTAPGIWLEHGDGLVVMLPGPPRELTDLFDRVVRERLLPIGGSTRLVRRVVRTAGRTESHIEEIAQPIYAAWAARPLPITTTVLASPAQIELHLMTAAAEEAEGQARLDAAVRELAEALGRDIFSVDGASLEEVVGEQLRRRGWQIAVAESCTGGLVSSRLTDVPGSSSYVTVNLVCYSNQAKQRWLGVSAQLLAEHGAVSEPVALAMAEGVRSLASSDVGVGVTGIAGPSGGSDAKPVGTVAIAVVAGAEHSVRTFRFPGDRDLVKRFASQNALDMVRRLLDASWPGRARRAGASGDGGRG